MQLIGRKLKRRRWSRSPRTRLGLDASSLLASEPSNANGSTKSSAMKMVSQSSSKLDWSPKDSHSEKDWTTRRLMLQSLDSPPFDCYWPLAHTMTWRSIRWTSKLHSSMVTSSMKSTCVSLKDIKSKVKNSWCASSTNHCMGSSKQDAAGTKRSMQHCSSLTSPD